MQFAKELHLLILVLQLLEAATDKKLQSLFSADYFVDVTVLPPPTVVEEDGGDMGASELSTFDLLNALADQWFNASSGLRCVLLLGGFVDYSSLLLRRFNR